MRPEEVSDILNRIDTLWPKCDWTGPARLLFAEKIGRFDQESVLAVVDECRALSRWSSPVMGEIVKGCRTAALQGGGGTATATREPPPVADPPGYTWERYASDMLRSGEFFPPERIADLERIARGEPSCHSLVARSQEQERNGGGRPVTLKDIAATVVGYDNPERERARQRNIDRATERDMGIE